MTVETVSIIPVARVKSRILLIRGQKVILDSELAELYGVETRVLNQAAKRNIDRFPSDFMFQLSKREYENLKSQFVTSSSDWGGRRKAPYAFTEHGAIMAASVLNSERAIQASIYVVRAFVKLRQMLATHKELAKKLTELERKLQTHDEQIKTLFDAIRELMLPPQTEPKKQVGYHTELQDHQKQATARKTKSARVVKYGKKTSK
ncbi:MAG TPA: ORF6N domain-containing protein [Sedimentisphaerales bacterium]|nr:ORF6N domain-containing protein [Sedimentisphaerales bacterium]